MTYYLYLFSPETYDAFGRSDRSVTGFRPGQRNATSKLRPGDRFVCYMTRLSRWVGVLEVRDGPFDDASPIFYPSDDPFTVRFHMKPVVWLPLDRTVPIHEELMWTRLSFTQKLPKGSTAWTGKVRGSLGRIEDGDGAYIESTLRQQENWWQALSS